MGQRGRQEAETARQGEARRAEGEKKARQLQQVATEQAQAAKERETQEKANAVAVRDFLRYRLLRPINPWERANRPALDGKRGQDALTVRELLDSAAREFGPKTIAARFPGQPLVQAEILETIGETYEGLYDSRQALVFVKAAADLRERHFGRNHPATLTSLVDVAFVNLVWSMASLTPGARAPVALTTEQLWAQFADPDAAKAGAALRRLTATPASTVRLIRDRLRPVRGVPDETVARLVADLDSSRFAARTSAERALAALAEQAEQALRTAAVRPRSAEQRRRISRLLARIDNPESTPEQLRALRAVEALESIGTPQARRVLAGGAARARLSVEAKAALDRLRLADGTKTQR